jgi:hypothetical protein
MPFISGSTISLKTRSKCALSLSKMERTSRAVGDSYIIYPFASRALLEKRCTPSSSSTMSTLSPEPSNSLEKAFFSV